MASGIDPKYLYSDLTHKIIGACFAVYNEVGGEHPEKTFCQLLSREFSAKELIFRREVVVDLIYKGAKVGKRRFDFVVLTPDGQIVIEIKVGQRLLRQDFQQIHEYLKMSGLKLGLLILFSSTRVVVKRVVNLY